MFSAVRVLVGWHIEWNDDAAHRIRELAIQIEKEDRHNLVGSVWLNAKYAEDGQLRNFINYNTSRWLSSSFLARQVVATLPRLRRMQKLCTEIERKVSDRGLSGAASVLRNLDNIRLAEKFDGRDILYFKHGNAADKTFPLHKFLICLEVLQSENFGSEEKSKLKRFLLENVKDPIYKMFFATL
ncbi:hypothetical protein [Azospirillum rugosum]|uniref:ApeA N-terminal domain-containing protein n=1 Tax=Azospirillum rugosum TaxID=416170 RepID=A0ABS4SPX0_9PROT|nr:hypothetical protein [Azospirillum rugosum]MBP2294507.1 hypothetical protein [Azospirillum rugosum]MDQ0529012.1 hypothetical protein [Azospirillum rugosum]